MENSFDFYPFAPAEGYVLCLKSLQSNLQAEYNGFQWPESGKCSAPDWKPTTACGNGLHAFLWGAGNSDLRCKDEDAKWLVVSVEASNIVDLDGKVKFPECNVIFCGDRETAVAIIQHFAPAGTATMFATVTGGSCATVTGGSRATVTGGDGATVTGGDGATVTGGDGATVTGGSRATVTGGSRATVTGGDGATVTGGSRATVTGGDGATVTAGDSGTATAGDSGTATAGDRGTATAGYSGTATAGLYGYIAIEYYDEEKGGIYIKKMAFVDNVTILAGVKYRLNYSNEFEAVNETVA